MSIIYREMKLEDVSAVAAIGAESSQSPWNENSVLTYFLRDDTLFVVAEESSDIAGRHVIRCRGRKQRY